MAKLQKPKFAFMGGKLRPWDEAVLHIGCEAVMRSLNVFEGVKGYWQPDGRFGIVMLKRHYDRLQRSARLLRLPWDQMYEQYKHAVDELIAALVESERDMWARTTLFAIEGHWGEGNVADLVVTAFHQEKAIPSPINLGVSTWQRSGDLALPSRIKTGTNYQVARLARMEGRDRCCQEMVLMNQWGRVAETTGACILMVREGVVYTPPATEGALESITLDIVEALALSMGMRFVKRPIDRTELLIADELAICGTLAEVTLVESIEGQQLTGKSSLLSTLQTRYFEAVRGTKPHPCVELSYVPVKKISSGAGS
ncbi:MAG: aminotransferase class IV [Nitrospira defluvii]|nr:aminotransferase class IV [Nitrospira defluvii]